MTTFRQMRKERAELDALVALAHREQRAGQLDAAVAAYRRILAIRPDIAAVHNDLGTILGQQGKLAEAAAQFERAIGLQPGYVEAHYNLGNTLRLQGNLDQAAARYRQVLALRPDLFEAQYNLAAVLHAQGKHEEAEAQRQSAIALRPDTAKAHIVQGDLLLSQGKLDEAAARFEQALAIQPNSAEAHYNLGIILAQRGGSDVALARFDRALALKPEFTEAHRGRGDVLLSLGKFDEATASYQQALARRPDVAETHNNLGVALWRQNKLDQATAQYQHALALKPDLVEAHNNLGRLLLDQDKLDEAAARYQQALALRPDYADAQMGLGNVLLNQSKVDEAAARFEQARVLRPDYADAHNNLGITLWHQGKLDQAMARFERAIALRPDYAEAQFGLAICCLAHGDYERGWPLYEGRLRMPGVKPLPNLPRWSGEPLAGRRLLLVAEQGVGDTLHFVRYARPLKQRGARVVLACPPALGRLLASHPDLDELFILGSAPQLPHCDFYLPLQSAPAAFRTDASTIPREIPYLSANPELTDKWRQELGKIDGFKIGIVWQGSRDYRFDRWRSIPLAQFAPLAKLPGVRLVGLQKGFGSEQIATVDFPVLDLSDRLDEVAGPFMDTAAVIQNLDLVVTPDTAIAHLAGTLGVPTWLALQFSADWRWLLDRDDSPWYPTMRLFRQTAFGDWPDVLERMAKAVQARRSETASPMFAKQE